MELLGALCLPFFLGNLFHFHFSGESKMVFSSLVGVNRVVFLYLVNEGDEA